MLIGWVVTSGSIGYIVAMQSKGLLNISHNLSKSLRGLKFGQPVSYVYDPTDYAHGPLSLYVRKYGHFPKKIVLVGMNPGPWGMLQTGVPFGEVNFVRDWMGIEGHVKPPEQLHPKRPVDGFACDRSEVSGRRLWGWARDRFGPAEEFFRDIWVVNYCPLAFFDEDGKNITPDKIKAEDRIDLYAMCDAALRETIDALTPEFIIGVGRFAYDRSKVALSGMELKIGRITHPSPANPAANRGWVALVEKELSDLGIELPNLD
jgi:single-strand selective monofunctional uracil DNA glycosylase